VVNADLSQIISDRLSSFELTLIIDGCTPEQAEQFRASVARQYQIATRGWDDSELDEGIPALEQIMLECLNGIEYHVVKEFVTTSGVTVERCEQCRYGTGHLRDDFTYRPSFELGREPHKYNQHLLYLKNHKVTKGKTRIIVKRVDVAQPLKPASTDSEVSAALKALCDEQTLNLAQGVASATSPQQRQNLQDALVDNYVQKDKLDVMEINGRPVTLANYEFLDHRNAVNQGHEEESESDKREKLKARDKMLTEGTQETRDSWEYLMRTYPDLMCQRWQQYLRWLSDVGNKPEGRSLTRWRDSGMFAPGNCEWLTKRQAADERRKKMEDLVESEEQSALSA